ncbi:MAG: hypothetical protein R8G66_23050 [Cytophagales bacterium]|nr:hypothetical protein [Cytophagales bacterium]
MSNNIFDFIRNKRTRIIATLVYIVFIVVFYFTEISEVYDKVFNRTPDNEFVRKIPESETKSELIQRIDSLESIIRAFQIRESENSLPDSDNENGKVQNHNKELVELRLEINSVEERVDKNFEDFKALRQALNPINPDEVLTIARMMDEIKSIQEQQSNFEKRIENNLESISRNVLYRTESADKTTNVILLVLAPILLNFFYAIWKDYKKEKPKEKEKTSANKQ